MRQRWKCSAICQGVVAAAGAAACRTYTHTHTDRERNTEHKQLGVCAKYACVWRSGCVSVGWSAVLNMMTSKCQRKRSVNLTLATRTKWHSPNIITSSANSDIAHTYKTNNKHGAHSHTHTQAATYRHTYNTNIAGPTAFIFKLQNVINLWQIFHCVPRDFVLLKQHLWQQQDRKVSPLPLPNPLPPAVLRLRVAIGNNIATCRALCDLILINFNVCLI